MQTRVKMLDTVEDAHDLIDPEEMKVPPPPGAAVTQEKAKGDRVVKETRVVKLFKDNEYVLPKSQADELIALNAAEAV